MSELYKNKTFKKAKLPTFLCSNTLGDDRPISDQLFPAITVGRCQFKKFQLYSIVMKKHLWVIAAATAIFVALLLGNKYLNSPFVDEDKIAQLKAEVALQREDFNNGRSVQEHQYQPPNSTKNVYFGDLHTHTNLSFDSYLFGNRLTIDDAYEFAKGTPLKTATGERMQLSRPLDFAAVTDHAEGFGMNETCKEPDLNSAVQEFCDDIEQPSFKLFMRLRRDGTKRPPQSLLGQLLADDKKLRRHAKSTWAHIVDSAHRHNEPQKFTAFAAYEYSPPLPDRGKIHRNVIFKNSAVPDYAPSAFDALTELDLWAQLIAECTGSCEYLTIPHNPNKSWGLAFAGKTIDGDPYQAADWQQRRKVEPLVEVFQIKGNSECSLGLGSTDEECGYEQFLPACKDGETTSCIHPTSMVRDGLKKGLELENELGFNPLEVGLIGSTDSHNSNPGDTEEWNFRGSSGFLTGSASYRVKGAPGLPKKNIGQTTTGGLAAIWAVENTRESLFEAMQRKEVYATSGTRIKLRFFGGFEFSPDLNDVGNLIEGAYQDAVSMGGVIRPNNNTNRIQGAPTFIVIALKDHSSAPLDRVQIIKGWTEGGKSYEKVIDVACSDDRMPMEDPQRCTPTEASVNLSDCSLNAQMGATELKAKWTDPNYVKDQNAFYYARVIENPSCRYSTYDSLRLGQPPRDDIPATTTEMAWSSPIWIKPG